MTRGLPNPFDAANVFLQNQMPRIVLTGRVPQPLCDRHKRAAAVLTVAGGPSHRRVLRVKREARRPWGAQKPPPQGVTWECRVRAWEQTWSCQRPQ